jgi:DNA-binding transcriptional LysR family regulator
VNLQWLITFRKVAEAGSFTRAADRLLLSQPAVSQQVRHLESFFKFKLLRQVGREIQLTDAGRLVYELACNIDASVESTRKAVENLSASTSVVVTVVSGPANLIRYVSPVLVTFHEEFPDVKVHTVNRSHELAIESVRNGTADIAIQNSLFLDSSLVAIPFCAEEIIGVCSAKHAFAKRAKIAPHELEPERVATLPQGSDTRKLFEEWLTNHSLILRDVQELASGEEIRYTAFQNMAIGIVSQFAVEKDLERGLLRRLPIEDLSLSRMNYLVHRKDISGPARQLIKLLLESQRAIARRH